MTSSPLTFPRTSSRARRARLVTVAMLALALSACGGGGKSEIEVAQVAVRANPALELVATDSQQGVLTVRVKATGQVVTVKASDVNAGTAFTSITVDTGASSGTAAPTATAPAASEPQTSSAQVSVPGVGVTASKEMTSSGEGVEQVRSDTSVRTAGGVSVDASSTTSQSGTVSRTRVTTPGGVTVDVPQGGQATVTTGSRGATPPPAAAPTPAAQARPATPAPPATGAPADLSPMFDESKLKRRTTPASCRAGQDASLIGVLLETDGVAVTVGSGCNMRIRGSLVVGGDTAIVVENGGNLWVEGSDIQSRGVSVRLEGGSNGYLAKSIFRGRVATQAGANMFDQGGNTWK